MTRVASPAQWPSATFHDSVGSAAPFSFRQSGVCAWRSNDWAPIDLFFFSVLFPLSSPEILFLKKKISLEGYLILIQFLFCY